MNALSSAPQYGETSEKIGAIALALAKAQGAMGNAKKDAKGRVGKDGGREYLYASLASVVDAARAALAANEIAVVQTTIPVGAEWVCVVTRLIHSSGEWLRGELSMPARQSDAQGFGSALTYARRYALSAMLGIAPEDDDGAEAVRGGTVTSSPRPARAAAPVVDRDAKPDNVVSPAPESEPRVRRTAAGGTSELRPNEVEAIKELAARFPLVSSHAELRAVWSRAVRLGHGTQASTAYQEWCQEAKRQTLAALGPEPLRAVPSPTEGGPCPAKASPAPAAEAPARKVLQ